MMISLTKLKIFKQNFKIKLLLIFCSFVININAFSNLTLVTPNGGETWYANTTQDIEWTGSNINGTVYLEYSVNGGQSWNYLYWAWSEDTGGVYSWLVPFVESSNVMIRATYWDNQNYLDVSDNVFEIVMPDFALISPNGGEFLYPTNNFDIQWIAENLNFIDIDFSFDSGLTWTSIASAVDASLQSLTWVIPNIPSYDCLIKITDTDDTLNFHQSNNVFTITDLPVITLLEPNGGEIIESGDVFNIQWSGSGISGNIYLEYSSDNGNTWTFIDWANGTSTGGNYNWDVPFSPSLNALVRAKIWNVPSVSDVSDNVFTVNLPTFVLIYPNGGETFFPGELIDVEWTALNSNFIHIDFSSDNGTTWTNIDSNINASLNTYQWTVPNNPSSDCLVKITDADVPSTNDACNNAFTINELPVIQLVSPNGGEILEAGNDYDIVWTGQHINGNIYIEYSVNNGQSWNYVGWGWSNLTGGSFTWTVPQNISSSCIVRVKYFDYQAANDVSDASFSIIMPSFSLIYPNGNELLYPTNTLNIQWVADNSNAIKLEFSQNNGLSWSLIADNVPAQQNAYLWTIPNNPSNECIIRITDMDNPLTQDQNSSVFIIYPIPSIQLIYPNGGEIFNVNDTVNIEWAGTNLNSAIYVEASYNSGIDWNYVGWVNGTPNGGNFEWVVPNNLTNSALIKVTFWDLPSIKDSSNNIFSIIPPDFALISPENNDAFYPGQTTLIEWFANNISSLNIDYSYDAGVSWHSVAQNVPATQNSYSWQIPNTPSTQCLVKISDFNDVQHFCISGNFEIMNLPTLEIVSPNGGELLIAGSVFEITWSGTYINDGINIEYSTNNGIDWFYIDWAQGTQNGGSYFWNVPYIVSNSVLIRIKMWNLPSVFDASDAVFSVALPSFALIQPNGGDYFYATQQTDIEWSALNSNFIRINYSIDNGNTWQLISDSVSASQGIFSWTIPNTPSTQCLVKITDIDDVLNTDISNTTFTILPLPTITLVYPDGGELFEGGQLVDIEWVGTGLEGNIYIEFSKNAGATWEYVGWEWSADNGGTHSWTVPYLSTSGALIRAKFWSTPNVIDQSNNVFSVQMPSFALTAPNNYENLYPTNNYTITWTAMNSSYIAIHYTIDNGNNWILIADSVAAAAGQYIWNIPNSPSTQCKVKITDMGNNSIFDISNNPFTIYSIPTLSLLTPNGGELLNSGQFYTIEWSGTNLNNAIYLEYSTNGGNTWVYMGWGYGNENGGTYDWSVPFVESQNAKVRVKFWSLQNVNDMSDANFTIQMPPFALISPQGGNYYYPSSTVSINWVANNTNFIKLEYSVNNGSTWMLIADNVPAHLSPFDWIVPNTPSNQCLVKITDIADTLTFAQSAEVFTIKVMPTIQLVYPLGGETWIAGELRNIEWTGTNLDGNVVIEFTTNNWLSANYAGGVWGESNGATYPVTVPFIQTSSAQVRVRMLEAPAVTDETNTTISISFPPFSLIAPNGNEQLYPTSSLQIKWYAASVDFVRLDYSIDNGISWINIEQSLNASTGFYDWTVPNTPSMFCKVRVSDVNDSTMFDLSDNIFTIKMLPTIQLQSPIGGEILTAGTYHNIIWTGTSLDGPVKVYYSVDYGQSWMYIDEIWDAYSGDTLNWFVPYHQSINCLVKAVLFYAPGVVGQSNTTFTIKYPDIGLITPNGNATYYPFNTQSIKWVAPNLSLINIEYTFDDTTWHNIAQNVDASLNEYPWIIPNTPSDSCRVRISDVSNPQLNDFSDTLFSILPLPEIYLVTPNGGEILTAGSLYQVEWTGHDLNGAVVVEYSIDNWATSHVGTWKYSEPNGDTLLWLVPFTPSNNARMRVYFYDAPIIQDESDSTFIIQNPPFAIVSPIGGETYFPTNEVFIQWIAQNATHIDITYSTDGGFTWQNIATNVNAAVGVYNWIVPNTPSNKCKVRIIDSYNSSNFSQSVNYFTIYPSPTIDLTYPDGGEVFFAGNTHLIEWSGTNLNGAVRLEYSLDAGASWLYIDNQYYMINGGSYFWQVPYDTTTKAKVRATFLGVSNLSDESNNLFSITYPSFALLYPNNTGITHYPTTQMDIQWVANNSTYIKLFYSTDNGVNWVLIQDSVDATLGHYLWTVPNTPSTNCKVRIIDVDNPLLYATSGFSFTIDFMPQIALVKPIGGEDFRAGDTIEIQWTGIYLTGGLYIDYSFDNGSTWTNIGSKWGMPNGDSYFWIAPHVVAEVLVKITYIELPNLSVQSDSVFTICYNPDLYIMTNPVVCQPNAVDISNYFTDSASTTGYVTYWYDSLATQQISDPHHIHNSGIYYILKETSFGSCSDIKPIEVLIGTTLQPPLVAPSHNVCSADTLNLLEATGVNIHWYYDVAFNSLIDTGNFLNTSQFLSDTIIYAFQYENPACPGLPAQVHINYGITPLSPIIPAQPDYCAGDSVNSLIATGGNVFWYADSNLTQLIYSGDSLNLLPLNGDTVFYAVQQEGFCFSDIVTVPINVNPVPPKPSILLNGSTLVSSSSVGNEWYNTQGDFLGNDQYFSPLVDGFYLVVVTINGCVSDTSDVVYYYITGFHIIDSENNFNIYPNPFTDEFYVQCMINNMDMINLEILNVSGKLLYSSTFSIAANADFKISTGNLSKGLYFVRLSNDTDIFYYKLIKQ
ncbi:MAG: T9SS type A sorting domain-containing protein [Bacteroidales bacterium]|nr:T9SS type A sorting domain-containing protein [Bacteroidales bacterium]